jgi:hypothetical protein
MARVLRYGSGAGRLARMEAEAKLPLFALDWLYVPAVMSANTLVKTKREGEEGVRARYARHAACVCPTRKGLLTPA